MCPVDRREWDDYVVASQRPPQRSVSCLRRKQVMPTRVDRSMHGNITIRRGRLL